MAATTDPDELLDLFEEPAPPREPVGKARVSLRSATAVSQRGCRHSVNDLDRCG